MSLFKTLVGVAKKLRQI